jgi:hypothetical protein
MNESDNSQETFGELMVRMLKETWGDDFPEVLKRVVEYANSQDETMRKVLARLGQHGWYVSLKMTRGFTYEIEQRLFRGDVSDADKFMCAFYKNHLNNIKKEITSLFPLRSSILKKAFIAHERKEYELSIPVFLAQADGICQDLSGRQLYRKRGKQPSTATFVEQTSWDSWIVPLLEPLRVSMPIEDVPNAVEKNLS